MVKMMKRYLPVLMASCLIALLLAPSGFALTTGGAVITVTGTNENHSYIAFQLFSGTADNDQTTLSNIAWGNDVDEEGLLEALMAANADQESALYGKFSGISAETTAPELGLMLQELSDSESRAFAVLAADYIDGSGQDGYYASGNYTINVPGAGYYLVADIVEGENTQEMYSGFIVRVVGSAVTVSPKISVPAIEKTVYDADSGNWVKGADYSIGEDILFHIEIQLPDNFADYKTYTCIVKDQLSDGLSYRQIKSVKLDDSDVIKEFYTDSADESGLLTINIDAKGAGAEDSSVIEIVYMAQLNSSAAAGSAETNSVTLTYSNNPTNSTNSTLTSDTPEDVVHVYTYRLNISKVVKGTAAALPGAVFQLTRDNNGVTQYAVVEDGKLKDWSNLSEDASSLTSVADGSIVLDGVGDGTYLLKEIEAPEKYDLLQDPITIVLNGEQDEHGLMSSLSCSVSGNGVVEDSVSADMNAGSASMTIENTKGSLLPSTGGKGALGWFAGGLILMAAAGSSTVIRKRRKTIEE